MANTRELIGDQATVDGLVSHTLTSLEEDSVTFIASYALYNNDGLVSVNFPNLITLNSNAMENCTSLTTVNMPSVVTLKTRAFYGCSSLTGVFTTPAQTIEPYVFYDTNINQLILPNCTTIGNGSINSPRCGLIDCGATITLNNAPQNAYSLVAVILRGESLSTCSSTTFNNTPIANGLGYIYVPTDLVDSYKSASEWSTYASQIVAISEYPKTLQDETITDSWEDIFEAENDGTYSTKYSVGDIKYLDINGIPVAMQIVAMDTDELSAGGVAKITWMSRGMMDSRPMNATAVTTNGWRFSDMRSWLRSTVYESIDATIRAEIKEVTKTYKDYTTNTTLSTSDTLWIPSCRELFGDTEDFGVTYTDFFTTDEIRSRRQWSYAGGTATFSTRSAISGTHFQIVSGVGRKYYAPGWNAAIPYGVILGFCT